MIRLTPDVTDREFKLVLVEVGLLEVWRESIRTGAYADEKDLEAALGCVRRAIRRERDRMPGRV